MKPETLPRIVYTNNSTEYWGRAAALIHVTPDGRQDLTPPANVRVYFWAGSQHGPGAIRDRVAGLAFPPNSLDQRPFQRATLDALHEWVRDGKEPPPSVYPRLEAGELVEPRKWNRPKGLRAALPGTARAARSLDFGPEFRSKGIVSQEPPGLGRAYPVLVPQADADGNDRGGIRLPEAAVPLGVYTGWNTRAPETGAAGAMSALAGSFFPFRRSEIARRYGSKEQWMARIAASAEELTAARRLLPEDRARILEHAGQLWDAVHAGPEKPAW